MNYSELRSLARMAAVVVAMMGAIHIMVSVAITLFVHFYYPERMFDVRALSDSRESPFIAGGFLGSNVNDSVVVAVGSSFTFGYPFAETWSMPGELNRQNIKTVNASIIGLGMEGISNWLLCEMQSRHLHARAIILEIPLINEMSWLPHQKSGMLPPCPSANRGGMFSIASRALLGRDWIRLLRDDYRTRPSPNPDFRTVENGYFSTAEDFRRVIPTFRANFASMYAQAKSISDNVVVFVTPVYLDGLSGLTKDDASVREQVTTAEAMCSEIAGNNCVNIMPLTKDERYYSNLTHFNGVGAKALANLIVPKLHSLPPALLPAKAD